MLLDLNFSLGRTLPMALQTEASECGLACLAMVASFHGHHVGLRELRQQFPTSLKGCNLEELLDIAERVGLVGRPLRLELNELHLLRAPAILHWDLGHFVVLKEVRGTKVVVHDPAAGAVEIPMDEVSSHFTGVALELSPRLDFKRKPPAPAIQLGQLLGRITGLKRALFQLLALAFVLELLSLTIPLVTQWITDEAIITADRSLLAVLALASAGVVTSIAAIGAVRSWISMYISANFNSQWMANVMGHLLRLPVQYFERRHVGDIVSRFGTVASIEHAITNVGVEILLDVVMAVGAFIMIAIYSPLLTAIASAAVVLYGAVRWLRYSAIKLAATGQVAKQAKEQSYLLETIRGAKSIKLQNREYERRSAWLALWVESANAGLVVQKMNLFFGTSWSIFSGLERTGALWLGGLYVIDHKMTLGMLFAYLAYKEQFSARLSQLIDRVFDMKMVSIQTERLGDIVLTTPERERTSERWVSSTNLAVEFRDLKFQYAKSEPEIISGVDARIGAGECVAIVGASGCGKTTLLKLLLGIEQPTGGKILISGTELSRIHPSDYRDAIACVLQDDHLFAGSIAENICLLAAHPDHEWMRKCAQTAGVHDEIVSMPMGYQTLVGDMGTVLSGGQKQRVLLARALYRRPKLLLLDEATSHLDLAKEKSVSSAIAEQAMTRIIVAHRPQTIESADRVFRLHDGRLIEVPKAPVLIPGTTAQPTNVSDTNVDPSKDSGPIPDLPQAAAA